MSVVKQVNTKYICSYMTDVKVTYTVQLNIYMLQTKYLIIPFAGRQEKLCTHDLSERRTDGLIDVEEGFLRLPSPCYGMPC